MGVGVVAGARTASSFVDVSADNNQVGAVLFEDDV